MRLPRRPAAPCRVSLASLLAALALACGGADDGATGDAARPSDMEPPAARAADTGTADRPSGDSARDGPDAGAMTGDPGIGLPALLYRASERDARERLAVLGEMRPPPEIDRDTVPNRHDPTRTDTVRTLRYTGLELEVYVVASSGRELLRTLRVTGEGYATEDGLAVGRSRERVRELRGEPTRTDEGVWIYEVPEGGHGPPTLLRVGFRDGRVSSLTWSFYID